MKKTVSSAVILLMSSSIAMAGGLDRSGQSISAIFADGDYAELTFGSVVPNVSGTGPGAGFVGTSPSENITPSYTQLGMSLKSQLDEKFSLALIYDQPFGADVDYSSVGYVLNGGGTKPNSAASVASDSITVIGRYEINHNVSIYTGLRYVQAKGTYGFNLTNYMSNYDTDGSFGYVVGGAYERENIGMRIAVTYSSGINLELNGNVGDNTLTANLPESVNLDFQTGIAADTLLLGSVRYVAWDGFTLIDSNNPTGTGSILSYEDDAYTYSIGIGRRITEKIAAAFSVGYEASSGEPSGQLGPADGYISYQIGASYTLDNSVELTGGVRYVDLGDTTTSPPVGGAFYDNYIVALGLKVAYNF